MNQGDGICSNKHIFASPVKCVTYNVGPEGLIYFIVQVGCALYRPPVNVTQASEQSVTVHLVQP